MEKREYLALVARARRLRAKFANLVRSMEELNLHGLQGREQRLEDMEVQAREVEEEIGEILPALEPEDAEEWAQILELLLGWVEGLRAARANLPTFGGVEEVEFPPEVGNLLWEGAFGIVWVQRVAVAACSDDPDDRRCLCSERGMSWDELVEEGDRMVGLSMEAFRKVVRLAQAHPGEAWAHYAQEMAGEQLLLLRRRPEQDQVH